MSTTVTQTPTAEALHAVADTLDALTHARVSPPDVYRALRVSIPDYTVRWKAYGVFESSVRSVPGYEGWLDRWIGPRSRVEVVALVRAAAEQAAQVTR